MCGIMGCVRIEGISESDLRTLLELIKLNLKRGPLAYGIISNHYLFKSIITPKEIDLNFLKKFIGEEYVLIHLRAPTGDAINDLEFAQPFVFDNSILLFNGMLTEWDNKKYKNDTYQVFDYFLHDKIEELCGSYACCWKKDNDIYLARCINSLYYNNNFFSSEPYKDFKELKHGKKINFITKELTKFKAYNPYAIE